MADGITIYEEVECINPYSKAGWFTNPIFEYEPDYFYMTQVHSRDVEVFLKNTGDSILVSSDEGYPLELFVLQFCSIITLSWVILAETQEDLDINDPGGSLAITTDLYPGDIFPFWIRVTVPLWYRVEDKRDMRIGLRGPTIPLV